MKIERNPVRLKEWRESTVSEIMGAKEAAEFLGISEPTLRQIAETDPTFPRRKVGARYLYGRTALVEWVNSGRD